ncbi:ETC complex I subunit [Rhodoligotrophos defluvii]|uniref:ETC complex I subunit n=1 Tax=Rhodoligotrophos defluvii TaxID=2561934 RepID=UPI0010C9C232|nr:ETC complex I subunit [Rhodoligotrophos defluvii]
MKVCIYKPAKTAMQSGLANTSRWFLEFDQQQPRTIDPLMGWTSSGDMRQQLRLRFDTKEEAIAYAERHGLEYRVIENQRAPIRPKAYSDNFKWGRIGNWTH